MADTNYEDFLLHVLPYVPNCSELQAINAIRNATIEFCKETNFLQQDMDPISSEYGNNTYDLEPPTGYIVGQILSMYYNNVAIPRKSQAEIEKKFTRDWQNVLGVPECFTQLDPVTFSVAASPSEAVTNVFTGRFSVVPTRASTKVDGKIIEYYAEEIASGALARLMATPNEPYFSAQGAGINMALFKSAKRNCASLVRGGMVHAPIRVKLKRFP